VKNRTSRASGTAYYTIGIFGQTSAAAPWMLQYGGHHVALNITVAGAFGVLTPTLTGAQPSSAEGCLDEATERANALLGCV
jgi:hypothetical protein